MQVTTGYGYFKDAQDHIVFKYQLPIGNHPTITNGLTQVEVEDQVALDAVQIYVVTPTAAQLFNVNQFQGDLLGAFGADTNVLPYFSVLVALANFQNFSDIKAIAGDLLTAGKLIQSEIDTLSGILANQNIIWADL